MSNEGQHIDEKGELISLADRLRYLIGNRSTRAAAKAWQLSYSTLNNYITRGTEPSLSVAAKIAELEGVSMELLAWGYRENDPVQTDENPAVYHVNRPEPAQNEPLLMAWMMVFNSLDTAEQEGLLRLIHKEGIKGILRESEQRHSLAQAISQLDETQRHDFYTQALALAAELKSEKKK
jgi:hypothetical protein